MYASRARACWIVAPLMGESFDVSVSVPSTIAEGRHTLRDGLAGWGCSNVDDVVLVFSELVTNATVQHRPIDDGHHPRPARLATARARLLALGP